MADVDEDAAVVTVVAAMAAVEAAARLVMTKTNFPFLLGQGSEQWIGSLWLGHLALASLDFVVFLKF